MQPWEVQPQFRHTASVVSMVIVPEETESSEGRPSDGQVKTHDVYWAWAPPAVAVPKYTETGEPLPPSAHPSPLASPHINKQQGTAMWANAKAAAASAEPANTDENADNGQAVGGAGAGAGAGADGSAQTENGTSGEGGATEPVDPRLAVLEAARDAYMAAGSTTGVMGAAGRPAISLYKNRGGSAPITAGRARDRGRIVVAYSDGSVLVADLRTMEQVRVERMGLSTTDGALPGGMTPELEDAIAAARARGLSALAHSQNTAKRSERLRSIAAAKQKHVTIGKGAHSEVVVLFVHI